MKEYDRFEKGAANGNTSTAILKRQLRDIKQLAPKQVTAWIVSKIAEGVTEKTVKGYAAALFRLGQGIDIIQGSCLFMKVT